MQPRISPPDTVDLRAPPAADQHLVRATRTAKSGPLDCLSPSSCLSVAATASSRPSWPSRQRIRASSQATRSARHTYLRPAAVWSAQNTFFPSPATAARNRTYRQVRCPLVTPAPFSRRLGVIPGVAFDCATCAAPADSNAAVGWDRPPPSATRLAGGKPGLWVAPPLARARWIDRRPGTLSRTCASPARRQIPPSREPRKPATPANPRPTSRRHRPVGG
jgi:hypothetical protein